MSKTLGKIKRLDPRDVWKHEEHEFTPWLKDHIELLATIIGLEIDVEREVSVGKFSADLAGRDLNSDRKVVIENQLGTTDHSHLGQLITYAAGTDAKIIIWVTPEFRDEHRAAIDWLNDVSAEDVGFFGVLVEIIQIDDSRPAPDFRLVAQPASWESNVPGSRISERGQAYHDFFTALLEELKKVNPNITRVKSVGYGNWFSFSAGRAGFGYSINFSMGGRFRVELYIDTGEKETNERILARLEEDASSIEQVIGEKLSWEKLEGKRACRVALYRPGAITDNSEMMSDLRHWACENMGRFRKVFMPKIKKLKL